MMRVSPVSIIQQSWVVEDHLLRVTMPESLTTVALQDSDVELCKIFDSSTSSSLHLLIDARSLRVYPSLADYMSLLCLKHAHLGWILTIGVERQPLLRFFLTTIMNTMRLRYRDFDTIEDAFAFARTIDSALINLPPDN